MPPKRTPADWTPPYPTWSANLAGVTDMVAVCYFAEQSGSNALGGTDFQSMLLSSFQAEDAPTTVERARFVDAGGRLNDVFLAYWVKADKYRSWWAASPLREWWEGEARLHGPCGYWREVHLQEVGRLETNTSAVNDALDQKGVTGAVGEVRGPILENGYWGAARDRIPDSAIDPFDPTRSEISERGSEADGRGLRLKPAVPDNVVVIRSGQDWTRSEGSELATYQRLVEPVLRAGMAYLENNPAASGCFSCRQMRQIDPSSETELAKTFTTACFLSLSHLENWCSSHPTHLAIFHKAHEMIKECNYNMSLHLWHEVLVLRKDASEVEYINCAGPIGFLRLG